MRDALTEEKSTKGPNVHDGSVKPQRGARGIVKICPV
jgi:hypothetical protein